MVMVGGVMEMGWAKQSVVCIVHRMERGRENRIGFMLHHHNCSRLFERIFENHVAAAALSLLLRVFQIQTRESTTKHQEPRIFTHSFSHTRRTEDRESRIEGIASLTASNTPYFPRILTLHQAENREQG